MVRVARFPHAAALLVVLGCSAAASAQDRAAVADDGERTVLLPPAPVRLDAALPPDVRSDARRPAALVPLYASFATLQVLDIHSTTKALADGAVEANPAMKAFAGNSIALTAMKAAGTTGVILISERLRRKNKAAAVGLMIAANSAMALVVQHNYRIGR
jgi:hypothetical protein